MTNNSEVLSHDVDAKALESVVARVEKLGGEVISLVDQIVDGVCADLDDYMQVIDHALIDTANPVTDAELDAFVLNLSSLLYFASSRQEDLGIKEDVAKAVQKDVYNRVREKAQGTVADKDMAAELQTQEEAITTIIMSRSYRKVKFRVEAATEMINSIKKVMSRRIVESELSQGDRPRRS